MSVQTLYTAATGMEALQTKLDVIANNLANVNTYGFKRDRANFEDLFYRNHILPGTLDSDGNLTATGTAVGLGSRVSGVQTMFTSGAIQVTEKPLDVAIHGNGFLRVLDTSGEILYTRSGNLNINANGELVVGSAQTGRLLQPPIVIPQEAESLTIGQDGTVTYRVPGTPESQQAGQIQMSLFINPDGLLKMGDNLYAQTDASSTPVDGTPGQNGLGILQQGALETSNVEPVQELIDLITTQRSFELNSQAVQAGDQILQLVANLRRY